MHLKIGELAKRAGLTVRTLHHYDHIGLLSPSARSTSGFRLYSQADVVRLHRIQALKQFGCSLTAICSFLSEPQASISEIIAQQLRDLDARMQRARTLRDRLSRLQERLASGEETELTDWLKILEMMTMYEKHLSRKELDTLFSKKAVRRLDEEWSRLADSVRDSMERGIPTSSTEAQNLGWMWMRLLRELTDNDAGLAMKLRQIHREQPEALLFKGISAAMLDYLTNCLASARAAIFARYLSPEELELVRARQTAHLFEWLPLVRDLQQQMLSGASPHAPEVQVLAQRWERLFRDSYTGGDAALEKKIRAAFRNEPVLQVNIGIDAPLLAFVKDALTHLKNAGTQPSQHPAVAPKPTALRVATYRAVHQLLDVPPVFDDPLALKVLGAAAEEALRRDLSSHQTPLLRGLRASVAVRSRLAEDEWARSRQNGVRQYVILGAGLDTYAYRHPREDTSRIFEVDLPATQLWKREKLRAAGLLEPAQVTYVPLDLERSTLAEALRQAGFSSNKPAFFAWLGTTMYLEEAAVWGTHRFIASLPRPSAVVFDYAVDPSLLSERELKGMKSLEARAAKHGEPWKTRFRPDTLCTALHALGFSAVIDYGPELINERYLAGRTDGLRKSGVSRLVHARV